MEMQVTPQGTECMRGLKAGEVQSHFKAPLLLYQKGLTNTFLRLIPTQDTSLSPGSGTATGGAPSSAPSAPPWGWAGAVSSITPFQKASGQGFGHSWWVPYRGQHSIFEWSYLPKAGFDIREDFST